MCRNEKEEGSYEYYEIKDEIENYLKTTEPQKKVEWKDILGRKFKRGVGKTISTLGVEV